MYKINSLSLFDFLEMKLELQWYKPISNTNTVEYSL